MGGKESKPSPPPPCFSKPWRPMPTSTQEYLDFFKSYKPQNSELPPLRILLHGPIGAGKSSFVNSAESALRGQVTTRALTDSTGGPTFTLGYNMYKIRKDSQSFYSLVFNNIMGFERNSDNGVQVEDVRLALQGHVRDGYMVNLIEIRDLFFKGALAKNGNSAILKKFNPDHPITTNDPKYNPSPSLGDKAHVLVCVVPADMVSLLSENVVQKLKEVRKTASGLGIPQVAILTKVDKACPEVKKDISNIYKSKYLKEKVERFSMLLGIPINCIFLVKNYESEIHIEDKISSPILTALKQMVSYGDDYVSYMES